MRTNLYSKGTTIPNNLRPIVTALASEDKVSRRCVTRLQVWPGRTEGSDAVLSLAKVLLYEMVVKRRSIKGGATPAGPCDVGATRRAPSRD